MTRGHGHELLPKSEKPAWAQWVWRKRDGVKVVLVDIVTVLALKFVSGLETVVKLDDIPAETRSVAKF